VLRRTSCVLLTVLALTPVVVGYAAEGILPAAKPVTVGEFPDISKADLDAAIAAQAVVLIDCNGSASYGQAHIPGAIDFAAVGDDLAQHLPQDKGVLVVAYCGGPACGAYKRGALAAASLGYTKVQHFSAGITGWKQAGGTLAP
jgi:rhodanese-related sulfurtransferase